MSCGHCRALPRRPRRKLSAILEDLDRVVLPGVTHWNHSPAPRIREGSPRCPPRTGPFPASRLFALAVINCQLREATFALDGVLHQDVYRIEEHYTDNHGQSVT